MNRNWKGVERDLQEAADGKAILSLHDVCKVVGCDVKTARGWLYKNHVHCVKTDGGRAVSVGVLSRVLDGRRTS